MRKYVKNEHKRPVSAERTVLTALFVLGTALIFGCGTGAEEQLAQAEPTVTATPEIISIHVVETEEEKAAIAAPIPTPTPTPAPTEVPFSYYAPTVNMTYEELVGSTDDMAAKPQDLLKDGYPDPKTYYIIVDKQWQVTLVYKRIDDGTKFGKPDYDQPVRYMLCSTGNPDKEYGHETTSGTWAIEVPKERFYQFVNLEAAQYLTLIHSRTYFHSILYKKNRDLSTLLHSSYDELGKKASHACIRLTVPDSRWMFYNIGYGTTCEIRNGDPNDAEVAGIRAKLVLAPSDSHIRLKAGAAPWTDNWQIADVEHVLPYKYAPAPKPDLGDGEDEDAAEAAGEATPDAGVPVDPSVVTPPPAVTEAPVVTEAPAAPPDLSADAF